MAATLCVFSLFLAACNRTEQEAQPDHPRLTPNVTMRDVAFRSAALNRDMQYRVVLPASIAAGVKLPVVYLLHGGGGNFRNWSNYSDVARFAERGLILVMPEGDESYYMNAAGRPRDRYEDYIVSDLIADIESKFPVAAGRANRAIVGVSMGGTARSSCPSAIPNCLLSPPGSVRPSMCPAAHFRLKEFHSGSTTGQFSGPGEAGHGARVIHLFSRTRWIR